MVTMRQIEKLGRRIGRQFHPDRVVLSGSYAAGTATTDSDVDLLVIMPFKGKSLHMSLAILNHLDERFPVDVITRRPADVRRRYAQCDPLVRKAIDHGKVLYERDG